MDCDETAMLSEAEIKTIADNLQRLPHIKHEDVYKKAVDAWGEDDQFRQAKEECAELIVAISHWQRGRISVDEVITEMVDVQLMINQLRYILIEDNAIWNTAFDMKINRARKLLQVENYGF